MLTFGQEAFDSNKDIDQLRLSLKTIPDATTPPEIPESYGKDQDVTTGNNTGATGGGSGGVSLGDQITYTLTTTDYMFNWSFPARPATLTDGTIVYIPSLPPL